MVVVITTASVFGFMAITEIIHWRRLRNAASLAFGLSLRPSFWVYAVPFLRVAGVAAMAWGLVTLLTLSPKSHQGDELSENEKKHLLLLLDVSPSMQLADAGQTKKQSRMHRTADVVQSLFDRLGVAKYRTTVVAFYTGAKPVVEKTSDIEVVGNIIRDLPMHHAFEAGKTNIFSGLKKAADVSHPWQPKSTLLVVLSDGDTIPPSGMPELPNSVGGVLVVGVGDQRAGSFIDGRQSRQDASMLRQLAVRLGGHYHNGNVKHIPTDTIRELAAMGSKPKSEEWTRREYALLACISSASILAVLPLLLHYLGTSWRPGVAVERGVGSTKTKVSHVMANRV